MSPAWRWRSPCRGTGGGRAHGRRTLGEIDDLPAEVIAAQSQPAGPVEKSAQPRPHDRLIRPHRELPQDESHIRSAARIHSWRTEDHAAYVQSCLVTIEAVAVQDHELKAVLQFPRAGKDAQRAVRAWRHIDVEPPQVQSARVHRRLLSAPMPSMSSRRRALLLAVVHG